MFIYRHTFIDAHYHDIHDTIFPGILFTIGSTFFIISLKGIILAHNTTARVIRSNQSLVLQKVTRQSSGNYSCSAINAEGETVSNQLELRVKCKLSLYIYSIIGT